MIRPARHADIPAVMAMIRELAEYEKASDQVRATEQDLGRALFRDSPAAFCHVARHDDEPAGFALWFLNFSTWTGRHGIYLEDLYVRPHLRRHGYGKALLVELARITVEYGYGRLDWSVLDWNEPAIRFYRSISAEAMDEWTVWRLSGPELGRLAAAEDTNRKD